MIMGAIANHEEEEGGTAVSAVSAAVILAGGLVAIPTETVYGLGGNAADGKAVAFLHAHDLHVVDVGAGTGALQPCIRGGAPAAPEAVISRSSSVS